MSRKKHGNRNYHGMQLSQDRHMGDNSSSIENAGLPSKKAVIYQSELDYMSRCILDYPNIETGGQLFGFWTSTGTPVVAYVIGPGRRAQHNPTSFIQDQEYLQTVGRELHQGYGLQHIGEWHSHHQLGLTHPSGGDVNTMQYGVGKPGFPRLLLCIGTLDGQHTTVNAYNFHENTPNEYEHAKWDVIPNDSPYRRLVDREMQQFLVHPTTGRACHGAIYASKPIGGNRASLSEHWLTKRVDNVETMKEFVSIVKDLYCGYEVKVELLPSEEPVIVVHNRNIRIKLPFGFPTRAPELMPIERGHSTYFVVPDYNDFIEWAPDNQPLIVAFRNWFYNAMILLANRRLSNIPRYISQPF